mgnify:CR=1 FL=1
MEIQISVSKISQYSSDEGGDTLEVVERPNGGLSVVLSAASTSVNNPKILSTIVVRKVISLLAEGVRDGAAARAASDYLYTEQDGRVSATLNILSVDLQTKTLVITRNNPTPVFIAHNDVIDSLGSDSVPIGTSRNIRPSICEFELTLGLTVILFTEGLSHAGEQYGKHMDIHTTIEAILEDQNPTAQEISDSLLSHAIRMEESRPSNDISIVVLRVVKRTGDMARRMTVRLPIGKD